MINKPKIIIANDIMYYSYIILSANLLNNTTPTFKKLKSKLSKEPLIFLNEYKVSKKNAGFVATNYSPLGDDQRKYFTIENGLKIDFIRTQIEDWYECKLINDKEYYYLLWLLLDAITKVSNTTGTYGAFLKKWDNRALKGILIKHIDLKRTTKKGHITTCQDANILIREVSGDILYIDPPYTSIEYSTAYHVLESIAIYDSPQLKGITGTRLSNTKRSNFSKKKLASSALEDIIKNADFKHIILSYSSHGIISFEEIEKMLKKYSINKQVVVKKIKYREYKNINNSNKGDLYEYLFYIEKYTHFLQSPLNYHGNKYHIIKQIRKYLPEENINTFIDLFAGGCNVGININANKVIYNDYNHYVMDLIKYLASPYKKIINDVEEEIKNFKLLDNKENFIKYRAYYNSKKLEERQPLELFVLVIFTFRNQIRFNNSQDFNNPHGSNGFNNNIKNKIQSFSNKINSTPYKITKYSFQKFPYKNVATDDFFYCDPPYLITTAAYNDGKRGFEGWDATHEIKLLEKLDELNSKNIKFMLSNVLEHKGKRNNILTEWLKQRNYKVIELNTSKRKEILVVNYTTKYIEYKTKIKD